MPNSLSYWLAVSLLGLTKPHNWLIIINQGMYVTQKFHTGTGKTWYTCNHGHPAHKMSTWPADTGKPMGMGI